MSICIISKYPFFNAFKRFLFYLHRMSLSGVHTVPVERYISHLVGFFPVLTFLILLTSFILLGINRISLFRRDIARSFVNIVENKFM